MQRKLIKVGTSAAILVPKEELEKHHVKVGDVISVELFSAKEANQRSKRTVNPEVIYWTDEFIKRHRRLLEKLADN